MDDEKPLKRCTKCRKVLYCDAECQKADWKAHKMVCYVESDKEPFL